MSGYGDFGAILQLMQLSNQQQQQREQEEREERRRWEEEEHAVRMESEKLEAIRKEIEECKRLAELGILSQKELDTAIARARAKLGL